MEEKNCEEAPQKKKLSEKQLKALEAGRELRKQANAKRRKQDLKLIELQDLYEKAREENIRIKEEIIQSKLEKINSETVALNAIAQKPVAIEPPKSETPKIEAETSTIEKPRPPPPQPPIPQQKPVAITKSHFNRTVTASVADFTFV